MGSMSTDTGFDPSTADMVLSDDDFTLDLDEDQADVVTAESERVVQRVRG